MKGKRLIALFCAACLLPAVWPGTPAAEPAPEAPVFQFEVLETQVLTGWFSTAEGKSITVDWGDGTRNTYSGQERRFGKNYGESAEKTVRIYAEDESALTGFQTLSHSMKIGFDLAGIPESLVHLRVATGGSVVRGRLADLPRGMTYFHCTGNNSITGDVSDLPAGLVHFALSGADSEFAGDIIHLPAGLKHLTVEGGTTITGDVRYLPEGLEYLRCTGASELSGNLSDLPRGLTYLYLIGRNTLQGELEGLPRELTYLLFHGNNTIGGELKNLPETLTTVDLLGRNTVTGDVGDLPSGLRHIRCSGVNTISGNLADLPGGMTGFVVSGRNTVTGDVAAVPPGLRWLELSGSDAARGITYSPGREWVKDMIGVRITSVRGQGLRQEAVDGLIIDLSGTTWTGNLRQIRLDGGNAPRSGASDGAVEKLEEMNIKVITN